MLRSSLIYLSKAKWARQIVTGRGFARRAASRFVAGSQLDEALVAIQKLNENGINASLDHLGENTTNEAEAQRATQDILRIFPAIQKTGVRANVSIKLTQIGLALDKDVCAENLEKILEVAQQTGNFVRIDMEDTPWTDKTLALFNEMRLERNFRGVGVVLQAYLFRTVEDLSQVVNTGGRVRLCKGAYNEPANLAYPRKADVNTNYDRLARMLIDGALAAGSPVLSDDQKIPPMVALATHDERRIANAIRYAKEVGLPKDAIEFQMLYGIRRDIQIRLVSEGYPVRVYVPYGTEWYPYFTRRLAERPANVWFFVSNFFVK